jgi:GNAT superfamily N-acetyltransferase
MNIIKVSDKKHKQEFLEVPKILYKDDDTWVCPLDVHINAIFDPEKNVYYRHGEAERWILKDDKAKLIGRIAAFIDRNTAYKNDQPTGGMGFFECINKKKAAFLLFDTARDWLKEKGMEAMDGPINFGETDKYWGLLVDGFTHPSFEISYNHQYYQDLFESYGFRTYYKQEGFHLDLSKKLPEKIMKIAEWVIHKPGYRYEQFVWERLEEQLPDFVEIYNTTWATFKENFEPLEPEYVRKSLQKSKIIIEEEFIWLAYHENKPIAIYIMFPDVNQIFKHFRGKLGVFGILKFLYLKKRKTITRARGLLMGVIPEFQGLGIEVAIIYHLSKVFERKQHYKEIEFNWVGDWNPKMRKIFLSVGSVPVKHYITYRYLFDRNKPFKRYPLPSEVSE